MASINYLKDITGKLPEINLIDLIDQLGLKGTLPENVQDLISDGDKLLDEGVHQYLCHLDKAPANKDCKTAKGIATREKDRYVGAIQVNSEPPELLYLIDGSLVSVPANARKRAVRASGSKWLSGSFSSNIGAAVRGQGINPNKPMGVLGIKAVEQDRRLDDGTEFEKAVEGAEGTSVGSRAVLFNVDGSVTKGANNIRDNYVAQERSSNIPSETANTGDIPKKVIKKRDYKTSYHPNKKKVAGTNDIMGGIAALGGVAALVGIIAALMPMHFVTSAITFLSSITGTVTNVGNIVNTFINVSSSLLSLFGIKGADKALKGVISSAMDNVFGKENVQEAKNLFASGINSISTTTKLLEQVQQARSSTNNKVDELAVQLGTVNNSLGEAGLIPPELMQSSKAVDDFVESRAKDSPDLKNNIDIITDELKDQDETKKLIKEEQDKLDKKRKADDKAVADVSKLAEAVKGDVDKVDVNRL